MLAAMLGIVSRCSFTAFVLVRLAVLMDNWNPSLWEGGIPEIHGSVCHDNDHHLQSLGTNQQFFPFGSGYASESRC